jgi:two-component system, LytTR family, response regulator
MSTAVQSITCLIVDDEPLARARSRSLIKEVGWLQCLGEAGSGRTAISAVDELSPDLLFLDIRLPGESGIEILRRMRRPPAVMFTTAYDEYALTAFELGAIDYLLKPFGRERFTKAMERARPVLELKAGADAGTRAREVFSGDRVTRLFVRDGGRIVPLPARAIERIEACDDYVVVYGASRTYRLNLQLTALERRLDPAQFVRIHRSHIVNLDSVASIAPYDGSRFQVTLRGGTAIVASRQRSRVLRQLVHGGSAGDRRD